ncbi:hypothetical protein ACROYT_G005627 [Oculina patagonica]
METSKIHHSNLQPQSEQHENLQVEKRSGTITICQNFEFNVTDSCNPTCNSLISAVMADMNLTSSSWTNTSRSNLLEFYRRATLGYSQELTQSMAELSRVQKVTTSPAYLKSLEDFMKNTLKGLVLKAVNRDRKLNGLPALSTTVGQQHSFTPVRPQSLDAVACHISQCVLSDLYAVANQMLIDLLRMKSSL